MGEFFRGFIVSDSDVEPVCTIGLRRALKIKGKFKARGEIQ
jgi:hypothetical protein